MAQNKQVPLTWGIGGTVVGTVAIEEGGVIVGEITEPAIAARIFPHTGGFSIVSEEDLKRD